MTEYIIFMLDDAPDRAAAESDQRWNEYIARLRRSGGFDGGSSIGSGQIVRKDRPGEPADPGVTGFIRVRADGIEEAKAFLVGNPVYEAGGSVIVRELTRQ